MANDDITTTARWLRRLPIMVMLVAALVGAFLLRDVLSFEALGRNKEALIQFRDAHYLLAVAGFVLTYIVIVALSLPGATIATLTGGFLFGVFPGVLFNVVAGGTGAILVFLAARAGFGESAARNMAAGGGKVAQLQEGLRENEWSVLFLMRLVPVVPFFLANLLPALVGSSLWRFAVTTYLGILPGALVFTAVGAGLGEVFASGATPDLGVIFSPAVLAPLLGLALLSALPMVLKLWKKRASNGSDHH